MRREPTSGAARRSTATTVLAAAALLLWLAPADAPAQIEPDPDAPPPSEPLPVESVGLSRNVVGVGRLMTFPGTVERVALADESLARVQIISGREILFTGLKPGRTTLYLWLADGRRLRYRFQVEPELEIVELVLAEIDSRIRLESTGDTLILRGEVPDGTARQAVRRVQGLLPGIRIIDLMGRAAAADETADERLQAALREIDERIRVRRVQVGDEPQLDQDTFILEGRVKNMAALVQAVTVAERQLGGTEVGVVPVGGDQQLAAGAFAGDEPPSGLAAHISRGLDLMSPSGRVISFLEVDEQPQILVSVRVLEIDRSKAKRAGVNFRIAGDKLTVGSLVGPQGLGGGSLIVDFVDDALAITTALDFLETKNLARSVAEPNVVTLSGEQATIAVGGQQPIPTTAVGNVTTVQGFSFQQFGVELTIRPTLVEGDVITLEVAPSITRRQPGIAVGGVPGFSFQNVRTTARVHAGQSLVIAGLLSFDEAFDEQRLPGVLGRIPLFRWRSRTRAETELLFVITPRFVSIDPAEPAPPIPPIDPETIELAPLDWPEDRDDWYDEFEPQTLGADGVPPSLRREHEEALRPLGEAPGPPPPAPLGEVPETELEAPFDEAEEGSSTDSAEAIGAVLPYRLISETADPCLNLRPEPSLAYAPLDCLPPGSRVLVLETLNDWSRVVVPNGREGWMASRYLAPEVGVER